MTQKQPVSFFKNMTSEEIIEAFFREHYASLCKSVNRLLANPSLSEDLVQEVFIKIWERKHQIAFNDRFIFYLKKSCYHAALGFLSSNKRHSNITEANYIEKENNVEKGIFHKELATAVREAISQLPEKTRLVFILSRYEDMTYKEIAVELKISVKAVEKHMSIALKRLKESLRDYLVCLVFLFFL